MSTSRDSQHRKPSPATRARTIAIRAAAIGAVAIPGAALSAEEIAAAQQSTAGPAQPLQDEAQAYAQTTGTPQADESELLTPSAVEVTLHRIAEQRDEAAAAALAASAAKAPKHTDTTAAATLSTVQYTVREGDSLSQIAQQTLGSANDYHEIYALNKDRIEPGGERFTDPSLIMPGWTLTLPAGAKAPAAAGTAEAESATAASTAAKTVYTSAPRAASVSTSSSTSQSTHSSSSSSSTSGTKSTDSTSKSTASTAKATGSLNDWINEAIAVLKSHGDEVSYNAIYETIMHESGGNPDAVNGSDSNAASGHPSIGLMQTIQSTFDEYALPGYRDIYNPVDNIVAAARYAAAVYGSLDEMVGARCDGSCWRGY